MCYFSTRLQSYQVRKVEEGEDLTIRVDKTGHHLPKASDGKIVCMTSGTEVHIASLQLDPGVSGSSTLWRALEPLFGKPVSGRFVELRGTHYAPDRILIANREVNFLYLAPGTTFYTGPKRLDVAEKLGVNDKSITLDHMPPEPKPEDEQLDENNLPVDPTDGPAEPVKEPAPDAPVAA